MSPTRAAALAALFALGLAPAARAQAPLRARALIPYTQRPEAITTLVVEANTERSLRADLVAHLSYAWPHGEGVVRGAVQLTPSALSLLTLPVPLGPFDSVRLSLDEAQTALGAAPHRDADVPLTHVAVVGLGQRFAARLCAAAERLECATLESSPLSGDPMIPAAPFAWGGTQAAVVDADTLRSLSPVARAAVDAWVRQGGVLAVTLRRDADRAALGEAASGPGTTMPFGTAWSYGFGALVATPLDPTVEDWDTRPDAARQLHLLAAGLQDTGAAMAPPGGLTFQRRYGNPDGALREVLRPQYNARRPLGPMAAVLALYIVAVGVMLHRNRSARAPLGALVRLPALAFAVLGAGFATTWLMRSHRTEARAVALLDLVAGRTDATERLFAGITAGSARALAVAPPAGHFVMLQTSTNATGGGLRWDGARLAVEGARLVLWETAALYTEGPADFGGAVSVTRDASGRPTVHNGTRLALARGSVLDRDGVSVWPVGPVAPGASTRADDVEVRVGGDNARRLFGGDVSIVTPAMRFVDDALGGVGARPGPVQYFATAPLPEALAHRLRTLGAAVVEGAALVRVVDTSLDPSTEMLPRARLDHALRTPGFHRAPPQLVPVRRSGAAETAGDAGALLPLFAPTDAGPAEDAR